MPPKPDSPNPTASATGRRALDRPTMIAAALRLLDEVGLEGLTLRRLATALSVQAPAIYWHFKNKQDLLDEMATTVLRDGARQLLPAPGMKWNKWAMVYGRGFRRLLLARRDGARMVSGTRLTDASLYAQMEQSLRVFVDAGFSPYQSVLAASTIYSYVVGFVIEEQAVYPEPGERDAFYDLQIRAQRVDAEKHPLALRAGKHLFTRFDRRFDDGLRLIIDGLAARRPTGASKNG